MTLVLNFYGGPGSGKSTLAAGTFAEVKWKGIEAELVTEYAKDKVWEEHYAVLEYQNYLFAKQLHRLERLRDKVEVIITDSPLLLTLVYGNNVPDVFRSYVTYCYSTWNNIDVFLDRQKPYSPVGRVQKTIEEARAIDEQIQQLFQTIKMPLIQLPGSKETTQTVVRMILSALSEQH